MNHTTRPLLESREDSGRSLSTNSTKERFIFDFTKEVSNFVDISDYAVEDLTYKVDHIVAYFKHATNDVEQLANDFWKNYFAGTPKDALILASQANLRLYPQMQTQLESQGISKADIYSIEVDYIEHSATGLLECFAIVSALVRSEPNDLPKNRGLMARLSR